MGNTAHKFMATTHEFRTAGRTSCAAVIPREEQALFLKGIDIWGLDDRITETGMITVTRIIRHNNDDVWLGVF